MLKSKPQNYVSKASMINEFDLGSEQNASESKENECVI